MIWEHLGPNGLHRREDTPCTKREFLGGRRMLCYACGVNRLFYPQKASAKCGKCGLGFQFFPYYLNSTMGENALPKCPGCGDWRNTRIID